MLSWMSCPGDGRPRGDHLAAHGLARRVDLHHVPPRRPLQELLVLLLDPALAHGLVPRVAAAPVVVDLVRADLPHLAQDVGREVALRIGAQVRVLQPDPRELPAPLGEVVVELRGDVLGQDHGLQRAAVAGVDLLDQLAQGQVELGGQPREHLLAPRAGQVAGVHDHVLPRPVRHQHVAVAIEDVAARGLGDDRAQAVALGRRRVVLPADDLEEPQAHQQQAEQAHRDGAEDGDAHGRARRELGRPAARRKASPATRSTPGLGAHADNP